MVVLIIAITLMVMFVTGYCLYDAFMTAGKADGWVQRTIAIIGVLAIVGYIILAFRGLW